MTCPICRMCAGAENKQWLFCLAFAGGFKREVPVGLCNRCTTELRLALKEIAGEDYEPGSTDNTTTHKVGRG